MKILLFSPHADDAEIGMCGTILKLVKEGANVKLLTAIIPCEELDGTSSSDFKGKRFSEQEKTAEALGIDLQILDLNPYEFKFDRVNIKHFDEIVRQYSPNAIYSCFSHDTHQDHMTISKIVEIVARKNTSSFYMYENMIPGGIPSQPFNPQYFVDISDFCHSKFEILNTYISVFSDKPKLIDTVMARSRYRGGQIGVENAETFQVIKQIDY